MADNTLTNFSSSGNRAMLIECLLKAEALSQLLLTPDFLKAPYSVKHDCLWTLSDLIYAARRLSEKLIPKPDPLH